MACLFFQTPAVACTRRAPAASAAGPCCPYLRHGTELQEPHAALESGISATLFSLHDCDYAGVVGEGDSVRVNPSQARLALGESVLLVAPSKSKVGPGPHKLA